MRFNASRKRSASAYGVDDLYGVAVMDLVPTMRAAWHDFAVDLDGDLAPGVAVYREQIRDTGWIGNVLFHAVESNLQHVQ